MDAESDFGNDSALLTRLARRPRSLGSVRSSNLSATPSFSVLSAYLSRNLRRHRPAANHNEGDSEIARKEVKARNRSEASFRQMYETLDQEHNDKVGLAKLRSLTVGLGISLRHGQTQQLFNRVDRDGDGAVTFEDFRLDWLERWKSSEDRRLLLIGLFKLLDVTGDGMIERKEVKMVMMSIGEKISNQEIDEMFKQFDKDNSGSVDQNEFVKAMMRHIEKHVIPKGRALQEIHEDAIRRAAAKRVRRLPTNYVVSAEDARASIRVSVV